MKGLLTYMAGIVVCMISGLVLMLRGHGDVGWFVSNFGLLAWTVLVIGYIAVFHSRKRWPDASALRRASYVITWKR